jgi:hypothetical protein
MTTAPTDLDALRRDLKVGLDLIDDKHDLYCKRRDYYDGTRSEIAASKEVRKLINQADGERHPISLAHIPVDALADKIEFSGFATKDAGAKKLLDDLYDAADLEDEADDWTRKASYFGDYYVIADVTEETTAGAATPTGLNLTGSSPLTTVVIYDEQTQRVAQYGVKRWHEGKTWKALVYYDDVTVKLTTAALDTRDKPNLDDFTLDTDETDQGDGQSAYVAHLGGRMLVTHYAVDDKPYGRPVHEKAFGPQDAITKVSAVNLANVDGQGFGARYAIADPMAEADDDIDSDFGPDGPDTQVGDYSHSGLTGAVAPNVATRAGRIALLKGIKTVGEFTATDSDDFIKNLDWYIRVMATATRVPMFEFDPESGTQISGIARLRAEAPLTRHAKKVERAVGNGHKNLGDTILAVSGIDPKSAELSATFRPTEVMNDLEGMSLISAKVKAGVPIRQAFAEAGYTPEQVDEWFPKNEPNVSLDALQVLASALQSLGQAKTLGVITDEELAAMLPDVLTAARQEGQPLEGFVAKPAPTVPPVGAPGAPQLVPQEDGTLAPPKDVTPPSLAPFAARTAAAAAGALKA